MKRYMRVLIAASGVCGVTQLVGCGALSQSARAVSHTVKNMGDDDNFDINEGNSGAGRGGLNALRGDNNGVNSKPMGELPNEDEIIWAPEDPDVPIPEFEGLAVDEGPEDSWFTDYKSAMQEARQQGKPMMVWFTSTRNSPLCAALSRELFASQEFNDWADLNVVCLRVDSNVVETKMHSRVERQKYVDAIKERYGVMGNPEVLVLSPRGTEFGKYRGYKRGSAEFYFGRLKNATRSATKDYSSWRNEMEQKGYRVWHSISGKGIFAKVSRYKSGKIWLIEPDGRKSMTPVTKLSLDDQKYIEMKLAKTRGEE